MSRPDKANQTAGRKTSRYVLTIVGGIFVAAFIVILFVSFLSNCTPVGI